MDVDVSQLDQGAAQTAFVPEALLEHGLALGHGLKAAQHHLGRHKELGVAGEHDPQQGGSAAGGAENKDDGAGQRGSDWGPHSTPRYSKFAMSTNSLQG